MAWTLDLDKELNKKIEDISKENNIDKIRVMEEIIKDGVERYKRDFNYESHIRRVLSRLK